VTQPAAAPQHPTRCHGPCALSSRAGEPGTSASTAPLCASSSDRCLDQRIALPAGETPEDKMDTAHRTIIHLGSDAFFRGSAQSAGVPACSGSLCAGWLRARAATEALARPYVGSSYPSSAARGAAEARAVSAVHLDTSRGAPPAHLRSW